MHTEPFGCSGHCSRIDRILRHWSPSAIPEGS